MQNTNVIERSPLERLKYFGGLLAFALLALLASFAAANYYHMAEQARAELQAKERVTNTENALRLRAVQEHALRAYNIRNQLEEIAYQQNDPVLRKTLLDFKLKMGVELTQADELLKKILVSGQYSSATHQQSFDFSIFGIANAASNQPPILRKENSPYALYLAVSILALILLASCWVLLFSKEASKVKFAQTMIQSLSGFSIGIIAGPTITKP